MKKEHIYIIILLIGVGLGYSLNHLSFPNERANREKTFEEIKNLPEQCKDKEGVDRDFCLKDLAFQNNDTELCDLITSKNIKNFCLGLVTRKDKYCRKIPEGEMRRICLKDN